MTALAILHGGTAPPLENWTVSALLDAAVKRNAEAVVIRQCDPSGGVCASISVGELADRAARLATVLASHFRPGERIGLWGSNGIDWATCQLAIARAGLLLVTIDTSLVEQDLRHLLESADLAGLFFDSQYRGRDLAALFETLAADFPGIRQRWLISDAPFLAENNPPMTDDRAQPGDPAMIVFTSGTTGRSKGVMLSHAGVVNNVRMAMDRTALPAGSVMLNMLPAYTIGSAGCLNLGVLANGHSQIIPDHFDAGVVLDLIAMQRISWLPLVPAMLIPLIEHPRFATTDLGSLLSFWIGGTIITPDIVRLGEEKLGAQAQMIYGQTEAAGLHAMTRRGDDAETIATTVGTPIAHGTIRIASLETGETCARGIIGEIREKSPFMTPGYFQNPQATAELFDDEGFMRTGDLGLIDADGRLRITGRLKEMIIRGGRNIYPREIEDVIAAFPGVAEVAVVGIPHRRWGEEVGAAIRPGAGQSLDMSALRAHVSGRLAAYKVPAHWRLVQDFPRGGQGKIRKMDLIAQFREEAS